MPIQAKQKTSKQTTARPTNHASGKVYDPEAKAKIFVNTMANQFKTPRYRYHADQFILSTVQLHRISNKHQKSIFFSPV